MQAHGYVGICAINLSNRGSFRIGSKPEARSRFALLAGRGGVLIMMASFSKARSSSLVRSSEPHLLIQFGRIHIPCRGTAMFGLLNNPPGLCSDPADAAHCIR